MFKVLFRLFALFFTAPREIREHSAVLRAEREDRFDAFEEDLEKKKGSDASSGESRDGSFPDFFGKLFNSLMGGEQDR